jgi:phage terminase large subunit-like protein
VSALYEQGKVHHVGNLEMLEDEMVTWEPGAPSPNRMDALVWAITDLMLSETHVPLIVR